MLQSALGILALPAIAWLLSENRRAVSWRRVAWGLALTLALAAIFFKVPPVRLAFSAANHAVEAIAAATRAGTSLVFGYLGGAPLPFEPRLPGSEFVLAFQALPIVLVVSVLTTLLFHWGILPPIVRAFSFLLERSMGVGGAVGLSTAANIFVGMVEAPLFIRPYLAGLSRSDLFVVMTGGMAGIAGTVLVLYAQILGPVIADATGHFIIASVLGAPAAVLIAQIMVPGTEAPQTAAVRVAALPAPANTMDAIVKGAMVGLELLLNIVVMLIVFVALVHLANALLALLPDVAGGAITLQRLLAYVMAPLCWLIGIPWAQAATAGSLMGAKTILNEFVAYLQMAQLPPDMLDARSRLIMLYALCGFANFGSLGIMIGGLSTIVPGRRDEIIALGMKSVIAGTLATLLIGAIAGLLA
ncbi:MAG: nucleoside:proton symporter [Proteobacteria bacterium]|nr:nucleoside:proton symporter [Pseudomonadota bacterium]